MDALTTIQTINIQKLMALLTAQGYLLEADERFTSISLEAVCTRTSTAVYVCTYLDGSNDPDSETCRVAVSHINGRLTADFCTE